MKAIVNTIPQASSLGNFIVSWEYDLSNISQYAYTFFNEGIIVPSFSADSKQHICLFSKNEKQIIIAPYGSLSTTNTSAIFPNSQIGGGSQVGLTTQWGQPSGGTAGNYLSILSSAGYAISMMCSKVVVGTFQ